MKKRVRSVARATIFINPQVRREIYKLVLRIAISTEDLLGPFPAKPTTIPVSRDPSNLKTFLLDVKKVFLLNGILYQNPCPCLCGPGCEVQSRQEQEFAIRAVIGKDLV
jgi:hypothetical protein